MSSQPDPLSNLWTAARVVATLSLACVSVIMVFVLMAYYPDVRIDIHLSELVWLFGIVGALVGWRSMGRKVSREGGTGIGLGIRAAITVALWIIFLLALNHLGKQILRDRLAGAEPIEALFVLGDKAMEYASLLLHAKVLGIAAFLGICAGVLTRNTSRVWR